MTKQTFTTFARKKVSPANALHHSTFIYNQFNNRILYPFRTKKEPSVFTAFLLATHSNFNLMTAKNQKHYVFRHEGRLNGIENDVVLLRYPKKHLENQKRCRLFSTHYLFINEWYSILLCIPIVNRSIFARSRQNWHWTAIKYVLHRNLKVLATDVTGTFYVHDRKGSVKNFS